MRSHMRGGASRMVGRTLRMSCGSFMRLSKKWTGMPQRIGRNSMTTRCAMCAEGRKATVASCGPMGNTNGQFVGVGAPVFLVAGAAGGISSVLGDLCPEEFRDAAVAGVAGQFIAPGRADDLGDLRVHVQSLQFVAPLRERTEEALVVETVRGFGVILHARDRV